MVHCYTDDCTDDEWIRKMPYIYANKWRHAQTVLVRLLHFISENFFLRTFLIYSLKVFLKKKNLEISSYLIQTMTARYKSEEWAP